MNDGSKIVIAEMVRDICFGFVVVAACHASDLSITASFWWGCVAWCVAFIFASHKKND